MSGMSPEAQDLLRRAERTFQPHAEAKLRVAAQLRRAQVLPSATAPRVPRSVWKLGLALLIAAGGWMALPTRTPDRLEAAPPVVPLEVLAPEPVEAPPAPQLPQVSVPAASAKPGRPSGLPAKSTPEAPAPVPAVDLLEAERRLLMAARSELEADRAEAALSLLKTAAQRFEPSALDAERYGLLARAYCATSRPTDAAAAAERLAPDSPYRRLARCSTNP